jgi:SAM-dependent methyltransferase
LRFDPARTSGIADITPPARRAGARDKAREAVDLLRYYVGRRSEATSFDSIFADIDEYDELLRHYADRTLRESRLFEIGFGARPYRMLALAAMGVDVSGVDADAPVVNGTPSEFRAVYRANGAERAARSLVRHTIFDRGQRRRFDEALAQRGLSARRIDDRLRVADAASLTLDPAQFDLILAEDVFEHIPREGLERLVATMGDWLRPGGIAAIRPNVFTGIIGGHLLEWNLESFDLDAPDRRSEPWDHLRERRFTPDTYINELTRADYRSLFSSHFEILEERVKVPDLGREHLTPEVRRELSDYPDEELFSNQVLFVLRPR